MDYLFLYHETATTEIYTLSLHDALPISKVRGKKQSTGTRIKEEAKVILNARMGRAVLGIADPNELRKVCYEDGRARLRSEEHTSELQSRENLVCRLLLEKKKNQIRETRE